MRAPTDAQPITSTTTLSDDAPGRNRGVAERSRRVANSGTPQDEGVAAALQQLAGDILQGNEGHGTVQFIGTFSTFSWTVPTPEYGHGFTFGIRTTEALEPNPAPEPATLALVGAALFGIAATRRRKASKPAV